MEKLLYEKSTPGRRGVKVPGFFDATADPALRLSDGVAREEAAALPELTELEVVRHFTRLSQRNFSIDTHFYPLGSCTMKYNPKANEAAAAMPGFATLHPWQTDPDDLQGMLRVYAEVGHWLAEVCGLAEFTLAPMAGAHGEFTGLLILKAYLESRGETARDTIVVPKSAHGTNPASAALCGFKVREVAEGPDGCVDLDALRAAVDEKTAGFMLTNPNTLGVFERRIREIADVVHEAGGLVYYDGANLNAIAGRARPGDMGYDIVHINLHKTFSTPHGGGGPGAGPVGVVEHLRRFLPVPRVKAVGGEGAATRYELVEQAADSVGRLGAFHGNAGVIVRCYNYMLNLGAEGIRAIADFAVLNANYVKARLAERYDAPFAGLCKHEFVLTLAREAKEHHVTAYNIAKRLLDYGFHAPTIYFPATVRECLLIEPTETESKRVLDDFVAAMLAIYDEIEREAPELLNAPVSLAIKRLDDVKAARELNVCCSVR